MCTQSTLILWIQENDLENEEENSDIDIPMRSSRALKWETLKDDEETSSEFDIIFEANTTDNLYENTCVSFNKETHDLATYNKTTASTLGRYKTL